MDNITNLILENEGVIYKVINRYKEYFELDDLYQVAVIGMIKAYKNYSNEYHTKFISYAYPYIFGEVIKYINEFRNIKVNKNSRMLYSRILKAKDILAQKLMKEPTIYEISFFLEIDVNVINDVMAANSMVDSLDKIISDDSKNFELYNKIGYYDETIEDFSLKNELSKLSTLEKQIIEARYFHDMSQKEVGDKFGMYQVEVSRKEKKILKKLRDGISE